MYIFLEILGVMGMIFLGLVIVFYSIMLLVIIRTIIEEIWEMIKRKLKKD